MKKVLLTIFGCCMFTLQGYSQKPQQVTASGGTTFVSSSATVSFTIGEVFISNYSSPSNIGEGFHQSGTNYITSVPDLQSRQAVDVYPNPSRCKIFVTASGSEKNIHRIVIYNLQGKIMLDRRFPDYPATVQLDIDHLDRGYYIIKVVNRNETLVLNRTLVKQ